MGVRGLEAGKRAALLISEFQQAMTVEALRDARDELARKVRENGVAEVIAELASDFHAASLPVFHSHLAPRADWSGFRVNCVLAGIVKRADTLRAGHQGADSHPLVTIEPGDYVIKRPTGMTSFYGTEVDALMRSLEIDTVVVVGVSINVAVLGSVIEAVNRGYEVVVADDCIAGIGPIQHTITTDLLPLLASVTDRKSIAAAIAARES